MLKRIFIAVLAGTFVLAGVSKAADGTKFLSSLYAFDTGLPDVLLRLTAVGLPVLEILCGLSLLLRPMREAALTWILAMLVVMLGILVQAWVRGLDVSCGCIDFSSLGLEHSALIEWFEKPAGATLKSAVLLGLALYVWKHREPAPKSNPLSEERTISGIKAGNPT